MATSGIGRRRMAARADASERYTERRDALVKAAAATFREKSFKAASLDDIAQVAGTDRASVYYYFAGKKELFYAVVLEALEASADNAEAIARRDGDPQDKLRELAVALMTSYETNYPALFVFLQEDPHTVASAGGAEGKRLLELAHRFDKAVLDIVREGVARGVFRSDVPPRVIVNGLLGMLNWTYRWYRPTDSLTGADLGAAFATLICDGVVVDSAS